MNFNGIEVNDSALDQVTGGNDKKVGDGYFNNNYTVPGHTVTDNATAPLKEIAKKYSAAVKESKESGK